jgi:transcriptional regulator with XRE-family HTH domain
MFRTIASELVRAVRGPRSQRALSRRLGFSTNVVYGWESGRAAPTALQFFELLEKSGVDTRVRVSGFYVKPPLWLSTMRVFPSRAGLAAFLRDQRGATTIQELAAGTGISRFALSRWFKGSAEPKLPDLLSVVQFTTLRMHDFVAQFVSPEAVPTLSREWQRQQAARKAAYDLPWTQAVLRSLELEAYGHLPKHEVGWIAKELGIDVDVEVEALRLLEFSGQVVRDGERYRAKPLAVDLRTDPRAAIAQRTFWTRVAMDRAPEDPGMYAFNVCGVSLRDLERLKQMQREYLKRARGIIAESQPVEVVALIQTQVFALSGHRPRGRG